MQQNFLFALLALPLAAVAEIITFQDAITGCENNAYCTGFQKCGTGYYHRPKSCGLWAGRSNTCCYRDSSTESCYDLSAFLEPFNFESSGTEANIQERCPSGTEATFVYLGPGPTRFGCCPPGSDAVVEIAAQNATFLESSVPLSEKGQTMIEYWCVAAGFQESASTPTSPSGSQTTTGATGTAESKPNSASINGVSAVLGFSILAIAGLLI
ncbi:hypothetical protein H072_6492 [Dactylellina haptotyla CBS 200.50]|uniref:Ig-like domain-containing protein n=1 Tax=Dactylellina haptotyla (strain CBS 200.50) TaxID=1284197 RepID=S8BWK8_DACHA|nr:hypothetical protein H072_6492 [Dactylellina haptotyla CBS 200.50]